jgi:hypothetical protein
MCSFRLVTIITCPRIKNNAECIQYSQGENQILIVDDMFDDVQYIIYTFHNCINDIVGQGLGYFFVLGVVYLFVIHIYGLFVNIVLRITIFDISIQY